MIWPCKTEFSKKKKGHTKDQLLEFSNCVAILHISPVSKHMVPRWSSTKKDACLREGWTHQSSSPHSRTSSGTLWNYRHCLGSFPNGSVRKQSGSSGCAWLGFTWWPQACSLTPFIEHMSHSCTGKRKGAVLSVHIVCMSKGGSTFQGLLI